MARDALRVRQGAGARYDAENAPSEDLLLARRGTAFFARKLMELSDKALFMPPHEGEKLRARIVASVSYAAREQAFALEKLINPEGSAGSEDRALSAPSLDLAETLPARALRHLFEHAAIHLNVCWRDLSDVDWDRYIEFDGGTALPVRELPRQRAREVWHQACALGNGAKHSDIPATLR